MNTSTEIILDKEKIIENCKKKLHHFPISDKLLTRLCTLHKCIALPSKPKYISNGKNIECLEEFYAYEDRISIDKSFRLTKD